MASNLLTKEEVTQHERLIAECYMQLGRSHISDSKRGELELHILHMKSELGHHLATLPKKQYRATGDKWASKEKSAKEKWSKNEHR